MEFGKDIVTEELTQLIKRATREELVLTLQDEKNIKVLANHTESEAFNAVLTTKLARVAIGGEVWTNALCSGLESVFQPDEVVCKTDKRGAQVRTQVFDSDKVKVAEVICGGCPAWEPCIEHARKSISLNVGILAGRTPQEWVNDVKVQQRKAREAKKLDIQSTSMASPKE